MNHTVSVIMPVYNDERYIEESVKSVLNQSYRNLELIIILDGCTDLTSQIIKRVAEVDNRVKVLEQENKGLASARNLGLKVVRGKYIAFIDSDDLWDKKKLEKQIEILENNPDVGLVSCYAAIIDKDSNVTGIRVGSKLNGYVFKKVIECNGIGCTSIPLIRKNQIDQADFFDEELFSGEDWDLWIKISKNCHFHTIEESLVFYRRSSLRLTNNYENLYKEYLKLTDKNISRKFVDEKNRNHFLSNNSLLIAIMCILDYNIRESWMFLIKSIKLNSFRVNILWLKILIFLIISSIIPKQIYYKFFLSVLGRYFFKLKVNNKGKTLCNA